MMDQSYILVINSGSSSIKFAVTDPVAGDRLITGIAEALHSEQATLITKNAEQQQKHPIANADHQQALQAIWQHLEQNLDDISERITGIGHRVVHGGERFSESVAIDDDIIHYLDSISYLAPLHNPANVACIKALKQLKPEWPQVAVFDTAYHQTMPKHAYLYGLSYDFYLHHAIRRYGFHGTSHRYVAQKAHELLGLDVAHSGLITAHLGNGCSLCAVKNGQSIDTTMGFTPLEGLMMGTRCGDLDPEVPLYLQQHLGYSVDQVRHLLNKNSGLVGMSQLSNDMRQLWEAADMGHEQAQLAIDMFCYRLSKAIAGYMTLLPNFDGIVFTGGVGENDYRVRERVLNQLAPLGFQVDTRANPQHGDSETGCITPSDKPGAYVIATDEEKMIAHDTFERIKG